MFMSRIVAVSLMLTGLMASTGSAQAPDAGGAKIADSPAVDLATVKTLSSVIERIAAKKIVYVGEEHDKAAHHQVQLEVIRGLRRQTSQLAIGMEMFQRPFQKSLDDYIAGSIDERTFLKRSEYFKRWGIDYNLYKPILDFARAEHLPVIALNIRREIVEKVAKSGLDSLSGEEKDQIPRDLDLSDHEYRSRLETVFAEHNRAGGKFEFFYQAQILWDETMAESLDGFLREHPGYRVVVLAGGGHLQYGSGIPRRSYRRNKLDYSIVLNDAAPKPGIADFVIFPESSEGQSAPTLGVTLAEEGSKGSITGLAKDGAAEKSGLKVGDIMIAIDDQPVCLIHEDARIALFYKKRGDVARVKVRRSDQELEFNVSL